MGSSMAATRPGPYHHGDARAALLEAAAAQLEEKGAAALSLRQIAEHAGLSRQAPYNHFLDKEAMLAELVREGFLKLARVLAKAARAADGGALGRAAEAYIAFGQSSPSLFRLMFSKELVDLARFPQARAAAEASLAELAKIIAGLDSTARVGESTLAAWCLVHGYTTLCIETNLEPNSRRAERARAFARIIEADLRAQRRAARA
jgi:AcrR family transcriptional regulator